jgi:hypothetical protein
MSSDTTSSVVVSLELFSRRHSLCYSIAVNVKTQCKKTQQPPREEEEDTIHTIDDTFPWWPVKSSLVASYKAEDTAIAKVDHLQSTKTTSTNKYKDSMVSMSRRRVKGALRLSLAASPRNNNNTSRFRLRTYQSRFVLAVFVCHKNMSLTFCSA